MWLLMHALSSNKPQLMTVMNEQSHPIKMNCLSMPKSMSVKEDQGAAGGITLEEIKNWGVFGNWWIFKISQPLPWASVHWLVQCTLECHWNATGDPVYTGTPLEKLSWNSPTLECHWRNLVESAPHWDATGETLTFAAYTGTPLEGLW